jgi:hypothetical protein
MKNSPRQPDVERDFIAALKELGVSIVVTCPAAPSTPSLLP